MRKINLFSLGTLTIALLLCWSTPLLAQLSDITQPGDPIVATSNNSPGSEGVANVIDNQPTKYLNFDKLNTGFTVTPQVGLSVVQCLTLTSANDAPERDPASYVLSGSYDGSNFTQIASGSVPTFTTRFQKVVIPLNNNTPYLIYQLIFPTVANASAANSMQISEVELLGFLAPTDVTRPGDPIVPSSNNSPGSEGVANAIDNQPTKYLNFDKLNTGFTVTPAVGGTLVSGITLTSANDAPERDPASYVLRGSLDGTTFFDIASGPVPAFPTRFYKNFIFFSNARAYRAYQVIFPTVANAGAANSMQISEVELLGVVSDTPQDVTQPGDPIVPTSNNSPGSEGVANAIDNQPTKYLNFDKLNTGFTVSPQAGLTIVSGLTLTSANDAPERDPASYVLSGSYDGSNFTQIASGDVTTFTNRFQKQTILFDNKIPYLQYRLIFPTVANAGAANSMQISEVELLGVLAPTDVTVPGDAIVASSNNSPGSEGVSNSIDNAPTKYLNFDKLNTGFTVTPGVGDTIVIGLSLTSANDAPERDPASYDLSGANDGSNFVHISSGAVAPFPARFYKQYIFFTDNTKSFKSYRLIFPTVANAAAANSMQISEVEFLGVTPGVINTNPANDLIVRQPVDAYVLLGSVATFRVDLSGPWKVQWYRNGTAIPGATTAVYSTPPAVAGDDGALFKAVVQSPHGQQTSDEVALHILTPSPTESISVSWEGSGANGAPTAMLPDDVTGFQKQAHWNNLVGGSGNLANPINSSNVANGTITINWAASGEWGVGTGNQDATERMLNGMATSFSTDASSAQTVTFSGVPAGSHSLFVYSVQVPKEFFNMNFTLTTHDSGGSDVTQQRFIRPMNADEYNPNPGFYLVTATDAASRGVGTMLRFDNLQPGPDGVIQLSFYAPGRAQPPGAQPIRGPGVNGMQLLLNPPPPPAAPLITLQPVSANGLAGGCITLSVQATGPGLSYQWFKNNKKITGATGPNLTLASLGTNDVGNYFVEVTNPAGTVHSRTAVVGILPSAQPTLGLITYFKFDDAGGADDVTTHNEVAAGQPGQVMGNPIPDWPPGQLGPASLSMENFPGEYMFVANYPKPSAAMTVSGWILSDTDQYGPIINNWLDGQAIGSSGQFFVEVVPDLGGAQNLSAGIEVGPNQVRTAGAIVDDPFVWHHFAMTANGTTLSIYWDGQLVNSVDYLGAINAPPFPWLSVGARSADNTGLVPNQPTFNGFMDDLALWNRSLSAAEVQGVYFGGLNGQDISQIAPVLTVGTCPPTVVCSPNITTECTGGLTPATYTVTAVDNAGAPLPVTCIPPSGTGFRVGTSNVVCSATDALGQSASCTFRVTIVDTTPPHMTCPSNIDAVASSPAGVAVTYVAAASDACGIATFGCSPLSGSTFPPGPTTVVCAASDSSGNSNSCSFLVTVIVNHPPVANPDTATTFEAVPVTFNVLANDSDPDGDPLSVLFAFLANPIHGSLSIAVNGTTTYTPDPGFLGTVSFEYTISDGHPGGTNHATVTINVISPNHPPTCVMQASCTFTANGNTYAIALDGSAACLTLDGSASTDPDNDPLTFGWTFDDTFPVTLTAAQEPGSLGGTGSGSGTFSLSGNTVTINVTFSGLSANSTAAHIHGPAGRGTNAAVLYPLLAITTLGSTAGTMNGTVTLVSGTGGFTLAQQLAQLRSGLWYINIHTTAHQGGEIRGQLDSPSLTGAVVTNCFDLGCHSVVLSVNDGHVTSRCETEICVIGASEAIDQCISLVDNADIGRKNKRPLIASLKAAGASFDRGDFIPAMNQLEAFQNKVAAQIGHDNPAAAAAFIDCAQKTLDAVSCGAAAALR